ncbi:hypothetical protein AN960_03725 [Bacillus sp. FJAT-25509]|uniref:hypothetical protein n=1 Tax=Bacillus sp. FJAT-25509 TaxID=1712029 RepID=UPI0006FE7BCE|nr:hypothetical protein [Bacillus sp. FJAT-25509]KQL42357.1 hypothetical protein AN960_03725 [Bacillus sp. FJAT-25509]
MEVLIQGDKLKELLNIIVSPYLLPLGLKWRGDYYWVGENENGIRKVFHYVPSKGGMGCFSYGYCLDFIPLLSGNKLRYFRTEKGARELISIRGDISEISQWVKDDVKQSIVNAIKTDIKQIEKHFKSVPSIEDVRKIAIKNMESGDQYFIYPSPFFVLAFIEAKIGNLDKGQELLEKYFSHSNEKENIREMLISKLVDLKKSN